VVEMRDSTGFRENLSRDLESVRLLTEQELAELIGVPRKTLQRWRLYNKGPRWRRLGGEQRGLIRYRLVDVLKWLESRPSGGG